MGISKGLPLIPGEQIKVDEEMIDKVARQLDSDSREILWHLWENRHASIEELASLYAASNHMDVLFKIREVINPASEKILGYSILTFEDSRFDEGTGRKIPFSWWIVGKRDQKEKSSRKPILDIFDEGDHLTIVVELLGVREEDICLEIERNKFGLKASGHGMRYQEEMVLPTLIDVDGVAKRYNNNVLEIRMEKI